MKLNLSKLNLSSDKVINPYDFKAQYNDKSIVVYQAFKKEID